MKKTFLTAAVLAFGLVAAQKKEIKDAYLAVEANDYAKARGDISKAEAIFGDKTYLLEPETQEQYYYAKGLVLINEKKTAEGAAYLAKIGDLSKNKIFNARNAQKQKFYFVGKQEADKFGAGLEVKESTYQPTTLGTIGNKINPILQASNDEAMKAYNSKNYAVAGDKFLEVYNLLKAAGQDEMLYKYYAATSYAAGKKYPEAVKVYSELINDGYTGVKTEYKAKNVKTGQVESLDKTSFELLKKTSKDYTDFKVETTPSVEQELYEITAELLMHTEKYDDALQLIEKGLKKFPKNAKLLEHQGTAYYKSGKIDDFVANLKKQVAANPNDKMSWYNLGFMTSKDPNRIEEAKVYYKKALEIDPNYKEALMAMFNAYLANDEKVIEQAEELRKAKKNDEFTKLLEERRERIKEGLPYLEKLYSLQPNDLEVVTLLKGAYQSVKNDAKFNELKAVEAKLKAK